MGKTKIGWTDRTDNPIYIRREDGSVGGHWCRKESEACKECYAEAMNNSSFFGFASHLPYTGDPPPDLYFDESLVQQWRRVKTPQKRFVGSMTDLFGPWVPFDWHRKTFDAAAAAPSQTIQLLTKHPANAIASIRQYLQLGHEFPRNIWMGVTIENQRRADQRLPFFKELTALLPDHIIWISYEPALAGVDFRPFFGSAKWIVMGGTNGKHETCIDDFARVVDDRDRWQDETGSNVALLMKQLGTRPFTRDPSLFPDATIKTVDPEGRHWLKTRDRHNADLNSFPECLQVFEFPVCQ